ncbi:MAG: EpsI family protein [Gammaproteobacteria bacterium]|nr:EpsI family protein [Gammaproteobacteria bacterium]MCF6230722.1 EpsI family protein [Gammaproteobacteria bacterium]
MKYEAKIQWKSALSLLLVGCGAILYSYWDTFSRLFALWNDVEGEYAHGWLIIAVVLFLVWDKRHSLPRMQPRLDIRPVIIIPFVGFFWLLGSLVDVNLVQVLSALLIMMLFVWFALGYSITKELLFAMLFIFFATPVWLPLQMPFQVITVHAVHQMLMLAGIPVIRDGYLLTIPEGSFAVLEACSGLRYFLVAFALSTLFSYLNFYSFKIRLLYVLLFLMASLLANWLRVFVVIYAGHLTQMEHPYIHDHANLGWYIFLVMVALLYWFGYKYLAKWDVVPAETEQKTAPVITNALFTSQPTKVAVLSLALVLLIAPPALSDYLRSNISMPLSNAEMPDIAGWATLSESPEQLVLPDYKGADFTIGTVYQGATSDVQAAVAYYSSSKPEASLIDYANHIVDGENWSQLTSEKDYSLLSGHVKEVTIRSGAGGERLAWYWYRIGGRVSAEKYQAKLFEVFGILTGRSDGALIIISAGYDVHPDEARSVLSSFYEEANAGLNGFVDGLASGSKANG